MQNEEYLRKYGVMVVGNGDVTSSERAARILREANCEKRVVGERYILCCFGESRAVRRDANGHDSPSEEELADEYKMDDEAERVILFFERSITKW